MLDYRVVYKLLRPYVGFGFPLPHWRREFTSQQKSAITRKWNQLNHFFTDDLKLNKEKISFIKTDQLSRSKIKTVKHNIDAVYTKNGFFYKYQNAKLKFTESGKTPLIELNISAYNRAGNLKKQRDIFVPIREEIRRDPNKLQQFVAEIRQKWNPSTVQWSYRDSKSRIQIDFEKMSLYFSGLFGDLPDEENEDYDYNLDAVDTFEGLADIYKKIGYRPNTHINKYTKDMKLQKKRKDAWKRLEANETWQFLDDVEKMYYFQYWNKIKKIKEGDDINGLFLIFYID